ncbi:hypothetical protein KGP65_25055 [Burkholderia multivorans]|uniref:hypothetical protein n=1 Tax=Burkholderia multivorans TaxID=87883 RepID=UPI0005BCF2A4|nr:hypothetical protein [Burkholderia multivorans]MCO8429849.1 hypothetical protein [Burkholderia multivorans]MCO8441259.1 hypothetical protein [Burkholderia multivorans]MCO8554528.1 hypothetical protein [Burkholderia multivorans]MCO8560558.1 hypothetical protein [Burkholderia multivorans]MCO8623628.1 hypothetical protein [Burkholderia multivorans]
MQVRFVADLVEQRFKLEIERRVIFVQHLQRIDAGRKTLSRMIVENAALKCGDRARAPSPARRDVVDAQREPDRRH